MIPLDRFPNHLITLTDSEWSKLFDLLPEIEKTEKFGHLRGMKKLVNGKIIFHHYDWTNIVTKFFNVITELSLMPVFDWMSWNEGKQILGSKTQVFEKLDPVTLCKLLTVIIRSDRFSEGYLIANFENQTIGKIIKALQNLKSN